ncbi:hypothetical protein AOCH_000210 [Aspergillus ochraceoroseus]|uniref:Uncharacterized protein n=1 Tax=Aspergillus ochraceoroseus TaxID=138278 RepID=A0A0F8WQH8_9EURO|nr:hypothetical protein AOCH_000210 [Aspergillus ochraceoroseus]
MRICIEVVELWRAETSNQQSIEHRTIAPKETPAWLKTGAERRDSTGESHRRLFRLVIASKDPSRDPPKHGQVDYLSQILDEFGLELVYNYAMSCFAARHRVSSDINKDGAHSPRIRALIPPETRRSMVNSNNNNNTPNPNNRNARDLRRRPPGTPRPVKPPPVPLGL